MTMAISKGAEEGSGAVICASTGNTAPRPPPTRRAAGMRAVVLMPEGQDRAGQAGAGRRLRRQGDRDRRQLRRRARHRARDRRASYPVTLVNSRQPLPHRGAEDRRLRDHATSWATRPTTTPSRSATRATSPPTGRATRIPGGGQVGTPAEDDGLPGRRRGAASCEGTGRREPRDHRHRHPHRQPGELEGGRGRRATNRAGSSTCVTDDEILEAYKLLAAHGGRVLRAGLGGLGRRGAQGSRRRAASAGGARRLRPHRPRPEGSRHRGAHGRTSPSSPAIRCARSSPCSRGERLRRRTDGRAVVVAGGSQVSKRVVLVPDGMADEPLDELGGLTPLEAAAYAAPRSPRAAGIVGLVRTVPEGMSAGSDVANLGVLGYDPRAVYTGRGPARGGEHRCRARAERHRLPLQPGHHRRRRDGRLHRRARRRRRAAR